MSAGRRIAAIAFVVVVLIALLPVFLHGAQLEWTRSGIIAACALFSLGSLVLNRWRRGLWMPLKDGTALPPGAVGIFGLIVAIMLVYAIVKPFHIFGNWFDAAMLLGFIVLLLAFRRVKGKAT
jgi:hypothetical protein